MVGEIRSDVSAPERGLEIRAPRGASNVRATPVAAAVGADRLVSPSSASRF